LDQKSSTQDFILQEGVKKEKKAGRQAGRQAGCHGRCDALHCSLTANPLLDTFNMNMGI
jgi:hypothetical protein